MIAWMNRRASARRGASSWASVSRRHDPARPGADGRELQAVVVQQPPELGRVDRIGRRRKDLDGVITERGRLAAALREVVPEDERAAAGLLHQADRNARFNGHARISLMGQSRMRGEAAVDVVGCAGDEAAGLLREHEQRGADQLVRLAEPGHGGLGQDLLDAFRGEDLAVLLGGEEAGTEGVDPHSLGASSRATFWVRLTTAAFDAE